MGKIVCLHGWATSPEFMTFQLKHFIKFFPELEFDCMQAPLVVPEPLVVDLKVRKLSPHKQYFSWKNFMFDEELSGQEYDFALAIDSVVDYINTKGPFEGICGFSMGGITAQIFMDLYEQGKLKDKLKVAGPKFIILSCSNYYHINNNLLVTPSIHLIGDRDFLIDSSAFITTKYLNPLVLRHSESHKFPKLSQYEIDAIKKYLGPLIGKVRRTLPRPNL